MKNKFKIIFILLFVILLNVNWSADKVLFALMEYAPLIGEKLNGYGIEPAIVTAAFKKVNVDVEYVFSPPARTYIAAEEGVYDGTVGWIWSEEREKSFYYSEPIFEASLVLFHLKEFKFDWEMMDDLKGIPIGITAKNYYVPEFHEALDAGTLAVNVASKDSIQFEKLLRHCIKIYPINNTNLEMRSIG